MKVFKHIFNRKLLNKQLNNFDIKEIPDLDSVKTIVKNWAYSIDNSDISKTKEESVQGDFLTHFFTNILGYKKRYGNKLWNITQEQKTDIDGTKADGALGFFTSDINDIRVVIELKDAKTDLDKKQNRSTKLTPVEQGFSYSSKSGKKCNWVIVSNFKEIRLYHSSTQGEYERFKITELTRDEELKRFYFLFNVDNLINRDKESIVESLYRKNEEEQTQISNLFYKDYKQCRINLFEHLKERNPNHDDLVLFEKSQKLMDRFIFVCFCEDTGLLPESIFRKVIQAAKVSFDFSDTKIWNQLRGLFHSIDKGNLNQGINKFNGGLFKDDEVLDQLVITDEIFSELEKISSYDFNSDLNVNILGHIFEQSINDIEDLKAEIRGEELDKNQGKRKREGIHYTPEYITRFIVEEAIGSWLADRKKELGEDDLPPIPELKKKMTASEKSKRTKAVKRHLEFWENYREKLANIKVLDPACGSGAFLNQAFDFLYREGQNVNEVIAELEGGQTTLFDLNKQILNNNLYGVDLNKESVEITKLSLWLKTANKHAELTTLDDNIRFGNSLVDDSNVAGDYAFSWHKEFKDIIDRGGFDVVIGNPPYVYAREKISSIDKEYYSINFQTAQYQFNTYSLFIEKAIKLLSNTGYLGYIVPNTLLKLSSMSQIRKYMLDLGKLDTIVQLFGKSFEDANVETVIILFQKGNYQQQYTSIYNVYNQLDLTNHHEIVDSSNWVDGLEYRFQVSINNETTNILSKIQKESVPLESFFEVKSGLKAYEKGKGNPKQTKEDVKNRPYDFDYKYDKNTFKYLDGKDLISSFINWDNKWLKYGDNLAAPRTFDIFCKPRVLIREITAKPPRCFICSYSEDTFLNNLSIINVLSKVDSKEDLRILLLLLNSKLMSYFFDKTNPKSNRKLFPKLILKDLKKFPIRLPIDKQPYVKKADELLTRKKDFNEKISTFKNRLKSRFELKSFSYHLESFYEMDFKGFLKELKHLKINLTLSEEDQWESYFQTYKSDIGEIQNEIDGIFMEIDSMVYQIYNLTDEEISIIEQEVNPTSIF